MTSGILLIDKPRGMLSFKLVQILRKQLGVQKIGHAGTLDPFATGVMIMLIGREYTRLSDLLLNKSKVYEAVVKLGEATDTYDCDGEITSSSSYQPTEEEIQKALTAFNGEIEQIPPMYSAKKVGGKKLCDLARKGHTIERAPCKVEVQTEWISYTYPYLHLRIACSKGTYIRSIAHDLGQILNCGAHLTELKRTACGPFTLDQCVSQELFNSPAFSASSYLLKTLP